MRQEGGKRDNNSFAIYLSFDFFFFLNNVWSTLLLSISMDFETIESARSMQFLAMWRNYEIFYIYMDIHPIIG